ncbi:UDP-2,4-diacetamido-2,4,6-trideoxy-beta-L-altropyranose hydrolase [Pontibacter sp. CAU 1760]
MNNRQRIIFRADGNSQIGLGHVVRSLALAAMLRQDFECVFAIQAPSNELQEQIMAVCHGMITLPVCPPAEARFNHELKAYTSSEEIVVLDGYHFDTAYQQRIKASGAVLVCIDDIPLFPFAADAVINQAGGVQAHTYRTAPYTKLHLGPAYALLRPPFLAAASKPRHLPEGNSRFLLNLGGADPKNHTLQIARALLERVPDTPLEIVIGNAYRYQVELEGWLQQQPFVTLHRNLSDAEMCQLMQQCTVAVTSASGVAYEYASVGGMLFVLQTADNQQAFYTFLTSSGVAKPYEALSSLLTLKSIEKSFKQQVTVQRHHFDGNSGDRLHQVFKQLSNMALLTFRQVREDDINLLFDWANDPEVRKHSFNPAPIAFENHSQWFRHIFQDEQTELYIAMIQGAPAAQLRFRIIECAATISYLISPEFRGKGLGHVVLQKGVAHLKLRRADVQTVEGLVQQANVASVRAFEKAGFRKISPSAEHPEALRFRLQLQQPPSQQL